MCTKCKELRSWIYEAINSLCDPQDASDHDGDHVAALLATMDEAVGKLRSGLKNTQLE